MIEEIKGLYSKINHKTNFIIKAAEVLGKKPTSLRSHWFGNFWSIPEHHQAEVKELLEKELEEQKETA